MTHRTAPPIPVEPTPDRPLGSARRSRSFHCDRAACLQSVQVRSSPHCWVRPLDRSTLGLRVGWAGGFQIGSTPSPINHNASSGGAGRGTSPRDSRCRRARGRAGPSGRRRGGTSPGWRARGRVPTGGGGETSVAKMAPEASSVTVCQQMRWLMANGTFSTASTCQISWGWTAWGPRRRPHGGAAAG
jgi:hypothetical protein